MRVLSLLSFFGVLAALAATTLGQSSSSSSSSSSSAAIAASSSSSSSAASSAASSASSSSSASSTGSSSGSSSSSRPSSSSGSSSSGMSSSISTGSSSSSSSSFMASSGASAGTTGAAAALSLANAADATVVNFALTLERLDSTFWSCYLSTYSTANQPYCAYVNVPRQFNQTDFTNAGYNATVWQAVNLIAAEEIAHAALLNMTVMGLGFAPVQPCMYQYQYPIVGGANITTVSQYLALGLQFETVGTAAYAGALNGLTNPALVQAAASIASVEARHAGYLSNLLGMQPFASSGFNDAYNSSYVASLISPFYVSQSCLAQTMLPAVRPYGVTGYPSAPATFTGAYVNPFGVNYTNAQKFNDIATLNYALVLEDLEATFYNTASQAFTSAQYTAAGYANSVPTYLGIIAQNENTHVAVLRTVITAYGGVPLQNCTYNFSAFNNVNAFTNISTYLAYASQLEAVGVMAYDGAANTITDTYLLQVAATIDMIEARHVAFINTLLYATNVSAISNVTAVFPTATDSPMNASQIFNLVVAAGIITGCQGQTIQLPGVVTPLPTYTISGAGSIVTPNSSLPTNGTNPYLPYSSSSTGAGSSGASATASAQWLLIVAAASAMVALML